MGGREGVKKKTKVMSVHKWGKMDTRDRDRDGLSAPDDSNRNSLQNGSGNEAGAAPRRERNVSPAGEFSAPHNVASA